MNISPFALNLMAISELGNVVTNYEAKTDACCINDVELV